MYDVLIRNGLVYDGSGKAPFISDMVFSAVVPFSASSGELSSSLYIIDFLDIPTSTGSSNICNSSSLFINI